MVNPFLKLSPYEYAHLTSHLAVSGLGDHFERLLAVETEHQRNAWFEAKQSNADLDAFIHDVEQAGRMAARDLVHQVVRTVRHAMLLSSARSVPPQFSPNIVLAAIRHGLWPVEIARKQADLLSDATQRSQAVVGLAPYLTEKLVEQTLINWTEGVPPAGWVDVFRHGIRTPFSG